MPTIDAQEIAKVFVGNWVSHYDVPLELHTDQRRSLKLNLFSEMCKQFKINEAKTTALHPQSDGVVEWFNRTLLKHLSKVENEHRENWDHYIPLFMLTY